MERNGRLTAREKLELVLGSYQVEKVKDYCQEQGIDRSYLYQLRREHEQSALGAWEAKKPGRPRKAQPEEPSEELAELRREYEELKDEALTWQIQAELGNLIVDLFDAAGVFEDKRIKKKLPRQVRKWISRRRSGG